MAFVVDVGMKIRERRLALGYTQQELAEKIGYKTKGSIQKLETQRDIPINKLKTIADALEVDIKWLMGWNDPDSIDTDIIANIMADKGKFELVKLLDKLNDDNLNKVYDIARALLLTQETGMQPKQ